MKKVILLASFFLAVIFAFAFSSSSTTYLPPEGHNDSIEVSYLNMTKEERMEMLSALKQEYISADNQPAADFIEGQMKMLENK